MTQLTRRLMLGVSAAALISSACMGAFIPGGAGGASPPSGPTGINTSGSTILLTSLTAGTFLTTATMVGGALPLSGGSPPTLTGPDAGKLQIVNINNAAGTWDIQVKSGATASPSTNWQFGMTVTDTNNNTFTSATSAYTVTVPAAPVVTVPAGSVLDNAAPGTPATTISVSSLIAITLLEDTTANSNYVVTPASGAFSSVNVSSTGPGSIGTQHVNIRATDACGFQGSSGSVSITVQDHTASNLIASFTAVNTSGSATAANANTIMHGHPFKKGQLPGGAVIVGSISGTTLSVTSTKKGAVAAGQTLYGPGIAQGTSIVSGSGSTWTLNNSQTVASTKITLVGQFPIFKQGTTVGKFSFGQPALWADGSLKNAVFFQQLPVAIAGNGTSTINIWTNGSAPGASTLSTSDISANTNFTFTGTILQSVVAGEIGQVWTASLNDAIANGSVELYAWGDAGSVYVIEGDFKRSGVAHGQLRCRWYVQILQTSAGALYGFRVLAQGSMPYYDVDSPAKGMRTFSSLVLANGATTIRDLARQWDSQGNPFTFSWNNGTTFNCSAGNPIFGTSSGGLACNLTTTGTLPSPLVSGSVYFTRFGASSGQVKLGTKTPAVINGSNLVTGTNNGSGTHTLTIVPAIAALSGFNSADTNAMYDYVQGGGSVAAETTVRFQMNTAYWISTRVLLPYVTQQGVTNKANQSVYLPSAAGGTSAASGIGNGPDQSLGTTGDIADLGPVPLQYVSHIINQDALSELVVRVNGMTDAHFPMHFRNSANGTIPGCNNTVYNGMTSQQTNLQWDGSNATGFNPAATNLSMTFSGTAGLSLSFDHMPDWSFYPYLLTGEPQYRDTMILKANAALYSRQPGAATMTPYGTLTGGGTKALTVGSTTYYQVFGDKGGSGERIDGWALARVSVVAGILADSIGENPYYKDYFTDIMNDTMNQAVAYIALCATQNSFVSTMGILNYKGQASNVEQAQFMLGYRMFAVGMAYGLGESAPALTVLNHLAKYNAYIFNNISLYTAAGSYDHITRLGVGSPVNITGITKANPGVVSVVSLSFQDRDIIEIISVSGMTQVNNQTFQVRNIVGNTFQLYDTSGNPVDTTGYGTYISGGIAGCKFITSIAQWGGSQKTSIGWTNTGSRRFTVKSNYGWTNYVPRDGDAFIFPYPAVHASLTALPGGFSMHQPLYYAINTLSLSFDLCTTPGNAGTIVLPTDTQAVSSGAVVQIVTPSVPNTINFPDNAGSYWLCSGPCHMANALGATIDQNFIAALGVQDQAIQTAGKASYAVNGKYCMVDSY